MVKIKPSSITAVLIFSLIFVTGLDILAYLIDKDYTITYQLQDYFGGSAASMRASLFGFVLGGLLVHVTQWGKREEELKVVQKPWGQYEDIFRSSNVVFKELIILPEESISLQYHALRDEFWYITHGEGFMENGEKKSKVKKGSAIKINKHDRHRITNVSSTDLLIISELQYGICNEDDIVRIEDKYGR